MKVWTEEVVSVDVWDRVKKKVVTVTTEKEMNRILDKGHPEYHVMCHRCHLYMGIN
jgi:hypothetical protein